jgi:hypothetical protein
MKDQFLFGKHQVVIVTQLRRLTHAPPVYERAVPAAQVNQEIAAAFAALDQLMQAGDGRALQVDRTPFPPPDGPGLPVQKREFPVGSGTKSSMPMVCRRPPST